MSVFKHPRSAYWQIEFRIDGHTFRGSSKTKNKKEAEAVERQWKAKAAFEIEERKRTGTGPLTLSLAASRYMSEVMSGKSSEADAHRALSRLLASIKGETLLSAVTDAHVSAFIAKRRKDNRWGVKTRKDETEMGLVSNATVNREVAVLKRIFMRARKTWKLQLPNEPDWRSHILPEEHERVRELQEVETQKVYAIREDYLPWLKFAHMSGLRLNETILKWSSVNLETGQIITRGKGNKRVTAQITPSIRAVLEECKGHHPVYVFTYVCKRTKKSEGLIRGRRYPLTYSGIQSLWRRLKTKQGLENLHIHDLRHDAASKIVRQTGNLKIAQRMLNHSSIAVTSRYAHVSDKEVAEAMEAVANSRTFPRTTDQKAS